MVKLGIVDAIVPEPVGGAHNDPDAAAGLLDRAMTGALRAVAGETAEVRVQRRYEKFRSMGRLGIDFTE
jgi:acetyl-CoA carboxylase carboxyl transferase subunit alpha